MQRLAEGGCVDYQETEIGVLYIDGQYWGHYNLRERICKSNICQFEGWEGDEDDIDLIKANTNVMQGSNDTMVQLLDYVKSHDMTTDEAYQVLDSAIDIQNYIEYLAIQMYTGNTDTLNVKRYRTPKADGKWRWVRHFSRVQLCDPINGSPPGSPVPGILQAGTLECVAIS